MFEARLRSNSNNAREPDQAMAGHFQAANAVRLKNSPGGFSRWQDG
jgi:hypothetical protein